MVQDKSLPLVGVIGCSGNQGSSILKSLLESGKYRVRGLSRNPASRACVNLLELDYGPNKSLLESDILCFDEMREETYQKALSGLDMLFAMTNPSLEDPMQELRVGKLIADYCKRLGIQHVIWSSLPNVERLTGGELKVPSFTAKAQVEDYMKQINLPFTAIMPGFFLTNLTQLDMFHFKKRGEEYILRLPLRENTKLPLLDPRMDMGPAVLYILNHRNDFMGKSVPLFSEERTMGEITKMIDRRARYEMVDGMALKRRSIEDREPRLTDAWIDMMLFFDRYGYYGGMTNIVNMKKMVKCEYEKVEDFMKNAKQTMLPAM